VPTGRTTTLEVPATPEQVAGGDVTGLAEELLGALSTVRRAALKNAAKPVELTSLTGAQLELVRLVRRRPGVSVAEAAAALRLAPNTVSTLVRALTDKGVMTRFVDPADRRVARLDLDPGVRRKVHAWRDRRAEAVAAAALRLSPDERAWLGPAARLLARLAEELEAT
jgi:DNA-binding MarR family transcriptional regulator